MTAQDQAIAQHYTHGKLEDAIQAGLVKMKDLSDAPAVELLGAVDEFHIGGRAATKAMTEQLCLHPGQSVLDIGCGLGGTARDLVSSYGCQVSGVDLTPEYISVGKHLNEHVGMGDAITLEVGSALKMPYDDDSFERATMMHVGMNISEKQALFDEIARVVQPDGYVGIYDIMRTGPAPLAYPVAWAASEETSFVTSPDEYQAGLAEAGFEVLDVEEKRDVALNFFAAIKARLANGGPPPLGLHIVMGQDARTKVGNMLANVENGIIAPVQIIARRR